MLSKSAVQKCRPKVPSKYDVQKWLGLPSKVFQSTTTKMIILLSVLISVLISAHTERFSVSRKMDLYYYICITINDQCDIFVLSLILPACHLMSSILPEKEKPLSREALNTVPNFFNLKSRGEELFTGAYCSPNFFLQKSYIGEQKTQFPQWY